ncbi:PAS domain-containing protein [Streptomyces tsukubensis]|uniref:histidine kinase n=1 Tax=Streptomyces tsukubensis (strain DSM 42081 / NBRC 108919 / NRRL 18488 / 9993) TaxID=1114943 RepID=A0A7G3UI74_STRT9|nr:PAS domain-containing protein [Streptomyces tsukubensis]AZK95105.1 PAS domain S-box protein [Streptomyces tsukubensis]QKM68830.1 PAS domain S-box protein [Streptomyces tsukubensis NRRL18488]TAI43635.1 PAS domain-containing protein [Streptomyces tsukubensis]
MSSRPSRGAARLAAILDALPDGLVLVNCNGTVVNANTIALELFETPGTALVGRGLLDLLPAFDSRLIPGSMRRPEAADARGRTKPTRMTARRTDGSEFPVEVTSASLEDGREAYDAQHSLYTGDELLMLVVRDLSGTVDTEAELARSQRQTEMILRAASEGVVGTDTEGRVVLVNPAAAQILGYRASDLGGRELHPLVLHSREDGKPFPYFESPLADTLRSGRKHRVRGQVLWAKDGSRVPVDLTTAPVRDGDQLVGAVMTFIDRRPAEKLAAEHEAALTELTERHSTELKETTGRLTSEHERTKEEYAAELADKTERYAADVETRDERHRELAERHGQLTAVLGEALRGPLEELRTELGTLAADPAGQLWPEANQILHHLAAGYARMTTLIDNVLAFQRLDTGEERLHKANTLLDSVVAAGVEGAVELIGPGRAQFAVHAPPIEAEVDGVRLATALAHLIADVAGVDATGKSRQLAIGNGPATYADSTIVVAAAQRGEVVRIEVRGPFTGGDGVHRPIVRGIVTAHGGVVQTHEVPGAGGSAYVLEVPIGAGSGAVAAPVPVAPVAPDGGSLGGSHEGGGTAGGPGQALALPEQASGETLGGGRRRARRSSTDAFLESPLAAEGAGEGGELIPAQDSGGTGRRRGRPSPAEGAVGAAAEDAGMAGMAAVAVPPQGMGMGTGPGAEQAEAERRARHSGVPELPVGPGLVPAAGPGMSAPVPAQGMAQGPGPGAGQGAGQGGAAGGRRARRALAPAPVAGAAGAGAADPQVRTPFALPPADADRVPGPGDTSGHGIRHETARFGPGGDQHTPPQPHPLPGTGTGPVSVPTQMPGTAPGAVPVPGQGTGPVPAPTGRRRGRPEHGAADDTAGAGLPGADALPGNHRNHGNHEAPEAPEAVAAAGAEAPGPSDDPQSPTQAHSQSTGSLSLPLPPAEPVPAAPPAGGPAVRPAAQPLPAETPSGSVPLPPDASQGRAFSVRALGQGGPGRTAAAAPAPVPPQQSSGSGRRRKLGTPPTADRPESAAPTPTPAAGTPLPAPAPAAHAPQSALDRDGDAPGRAYAISAPDEGAAEGPEPLDGPGGAVEVANRPLPQPVDDELPPEPLDNPRRLLVWPAPDVSTQQALSERGYRPVVVHSREEVDAQIAAFPAALFVDPLTGPITRTALQSLRQAAVAAEVPVLVTAGLGQATREAAYGADPAVLLKALAPRDSEQHPSRVLLIEEHEEIALALTEALERRGMQVARAAADAEAVTLASQMRPNLVVMDLMQVRRRRAGIIDWLRANGRLNRTPLVVYTSAGLNRAELPRLSSGETVLFLAERSTSTEVQSRIVDLLAKIGTN